MRNGHRMKKKKKKRRKKAVMRKRGGTLGGRSRRYDLVYLLSGERERES